MDDELRALGAIADPAERLRRAHDLVTRMQAMSTELSRMRREAIEELIAGGTRQTDIARLLGVTTSRISQLRASAPNIERALLGAGPVTIAVGGKWEAQKSHPSAVISTEALAACTVLGDMCRNYSLGLAVPDYEVIPPPGIVVLNRDNLIVLTSPRLLPLVGQVLDSDEHLGFESTDEGWRLVDRDSGAVYQSTAERNSTVDYAYLGRLPRPDGKGTFLYLAGIHAMGTLGAAHFLRDNIEDLYREVKTHRWSTLIRCDYDSADRTVRSTERIAPVHVTRS